MRCKHCLQQIYQTGLWGGMDYIWASVDKTKKCVPESRRHSPANESEIVKSILNKYEKDN
jgi:hypothetical protein